MKTVFPMTREAWLLKVAMSLVPSVEEVTDRKMPKFRISIGFPSRRALASQAQMAECWPVQASSDGTIEIFVSPLHKTDLEIAGSIAHELIHAIGILDHRQAFSVAARALGLKGKPTATKPGQPFIDFIKPILKSVGAFPGGEMVIYTGKTSHYTKQNCRFVKLKCPSCGMIIRTTRKWLDEVGPPRCSCLYDKPVGGPHFEED